MTQRIHNLLKRSGFIVGIIRALRAGLIDVKKVYAFTVRKRKVKAYLDNNAIKKLQLGGK